MLTDDLADGAGKATVYLIADRLYLLDWFPLARQAMTTQCHSEATRV
jgi:hypothetical protein